MRILAGEFKGRTLLAPPRVAATRPITSAAKKSLFDILAPVLEGAAVVDLYCGTGTLGLEALSRGAGQCWFADRDRRVLERLRRNIQQLGVQERCTLWSGDIATRLVGWLNGMPTRINLVFVDPPYADARRWSWARASQTLFAPLAASLADGGLVVLRVPAELELPPRLGPLAAQRTKRYGEMTVSLWQLAGEEGA